jgi:hypothetical protein
LVLMIVGLTSFSLALQEQPQEFIDGTKWRTMSMEAKLGYLMGFQEGLKISHTAVLLEKKDAEDVESVVELLDRLESWIQTYTLGETRLGLIILSMDSVFAIDANKNLIAAAVVPLVTKRISGEISGADFNERIEKLREVLK